MRMALTPFLSTAKSLLLSHSSPRLVNVDGHRIRSGRRMIICRAVNEQEPAQLVVMSKRGLLAGSVISSVVLVVSNGASGAILEADDDVELLEKVKKDRKKRLERQGVMEKEAGYLQDVVYKLRKVGQAIDNNDLNTATSVLGRTTDSDWLQKANTAFTKLSDSPEEKTEVHTFNSSLASLISSVLKSDIESSKIAFVESASAFEKWTTLTGLYGQLKGL